MARQKRQGGARRPSATEAESSSPERKEEVKRAKHQQGGVTDNLNLCSHYANKTAELTKILERIKSSSSNDLRCKDCNDHVSESAVLWVCLECEHVLCGDEDDTGPAGHIFYHGAVNDHVGCIRIDMPNKIWCSICAVDDEQEGVDDEQVYDPYFVEHCPCRNALFVPALEKIKSGCSSSSDGIIARSCQACGKGCSESTFLWVCLFCESTLCGGENDLGPTGHIAEHEKLTCHLLCTRLDMLSTVWCYGCNKKVELLPTDVEGEQQEADIPESESKGGFVVKQLPNYQMNCYFNSVLQNLFAMDRLRQRLECLEHPWGDVTLELKRLFAESCDDSVQFMNPLNLRILLSMEGRFLPGRQEDSHELLLYLLGKLESEETEFVSDLFHGKLSSIVRCTRCGATSRTQDVFTVLSLDLPLEMLRDRTTETVERYLVDKFFEGRSPFLFPDDAESDDPPYAPSLRGEDEDNDIKTSGYYADGSELMHDSAGYDEPQSSDAAPTGNTERGKEQPSESAMASEGKISVGKDVDKDTGAVRVDENGLSIESCLESYTEPEYMFDRRCEHCSPSPPCKHHRRRKLAAAPSGSSERAIKDKSIGIECEGGGLIKAEKRLLIKKAPVILAIHLKRSLHVKIEDHVVFNEKLDLKPYMDLSSDNEEEQQYVYHLTGVVEHRGSTVGTGHYFAYVRRKTSQGATAWFLANDEAVQEVPLAQVFQSIVYMLFYERDGDAL